MCWFSNCVNWISTSCFPGVWVYVDDCVYVLTIDSRLAGSDLRLIDYWTRSCKYELSAFIISTGCCAIASFSIRGRVRRPPGSAGSLRVGPQISRSASGTTSVSFTSAPVFQTVVVSFRLSLPASASVPATSSPPSLVTTDADPVRSGKNRRSSRSSASTSPNVPERHFHLDLVTQCLPLRLGRY